MAEEILPQLQAVLAESSDTNKKIEKYKAIQAAALGAKSVAQLKAIAEHLASEAVPLVVARQVLQELTLALGSLAPADLKELGLFTIERVHPRGASFEEQSSTIRERLAEVYEAEEDWSAAAKMLASIPLDSGIRVLDDNYKVEKYIKIAMLYLQDEEAVSAETYINRASLLITEDTVISNALRLQHKVCYARILDSKRKFLEAATRYYQLSQLTGELRALVSDEEVLTALRMAATCAILAPAGPQRSRMLGTLYKDERSRTLQHFSVLEKMFMDRLLRPEEVASFASELATHQKATVEDGSTVLDKAVREHNMIATSHLYTNISFAELGALLGIEAGKAERMAAAMLCEKRLAGSIDQPSSRIHFEHKPAGADTAGGTADALHAFDAQVEGICRSVESIAGAIGERFPEYAMAAGAGGAP